MTLAYTNYSLHRFKVSEDYFVLVLLGTLGASLLESMLTEKGMLRAGYGIKEGERILRTGYKASVKKKSTLSFNKLWNTEMLSKWT